MNLNRKIEVLLRGENFYHRFAFCNYITKVSIVLIYHELLRNQATVVYQIGSQV
jgi:hypothetical protein